MTNRRDDTDFPARQERFLASAERTIRAANREIIHKHLPTFTAEDVTKLAVVVAELRARYLVAARQLIERELGVVPDSVDIAHLAKARETYDEGVHAYEALRRAIERGYVDIHG